MSPRDYDSVLAKHMMLADLPASAGKINAHRIIRDKMLDVERANSADAARTSAGGWRDAARLKAIDDLRREDEANITFAVFLID